MEDTGLYVIGLATPKGSKAELGLVGWLHADYVHNVRTFQSHKNQIPNFREFGTFLTVETLIQEVVGPPYSRTKIYAAHMSRGSSCCRSISAARARPKQQTRHRRCCCCRSTGQTDGRTDGHSTVL